MVTSTKPQNPVQLAVIGAPHGVQGALRVRTFTADPLALGAYGPLFSRDGRGFTVADVRPAKNGVNVRFEEIRNRAQAEGLAGTALYVDRAVLPDDLEEEEFYHADLIGLRVLDTDGAQVGRVAALHDFGAGDILELALKGGRKTMAPFTKAAFPELDIAAGTITLDAFAAGLGDELPDGVAGRSGKNRPKQDEDS